MEAYFKIFVNWKENNWARLLLMAEFVYNNAKNTSIGHILFELNHNYHSKVLLKEDVNFCSRSCSVDKLAKKLKELIKVYCQNLLHA